PPTTFSPSGWIRHLREGFFISGASGYSLKRPQIVDEDETILSRRNAGFNRRGQRQLAGQRKNQMDKELTAKQSRFVDEYLIDLNATQAAIRAGYSQKTAQEIGSENLSKPIIAAAIQAAMDKRSEAAGITAKYVLETIVDTIERCKQARPVLYKDGSKVYVDTPDGDIVPAYTFEANAVLKGAELLGKHLKLFTDKTEHSGPNGGPVDMNMTITMVKPK
ncbi:MAG: terminase small subunit, partial [Burkholderiaceae bacterium]